MPRNRASGIFFFPVLAVAGAGSILVAERYGEGALYGYLAFLGLVAAVWIYRRSRDL
jgi:hypothetical protein